MQAAVGQEVGTVGWRPVGTISECAPGTHVILRWPDDHVEYATVVKEGPRVGLAYWTRTDFPDLRPQVVEPPTYWMPLTYGVDQVTIPVEIEMKTVCPEPPYLGRYYDVETNTTLTVYVLRLHGVLQAVDLKSGTFLLPQSKVTQVDPLPAGSRVTLG